MAADKKSYSQCARCAAKTCYPFALVKDPLPPVDEAPETCPMRNYPTLIKKAAERYREESVRKFARLASVQEAECYELTGDGLKTKITRIEEIVQFSRKCGFKRLGLAFCIGLREEARQVATIFEDNGFEVVSVCCKVGRVPKEAIRVAPEEKIALPEMFEPMCNPIAQAEIINAEDVHLAVQLGLCVGHDSLFIRHCQPLTTVLAVKDRVLGHNPLAAVYLSKSPYYSRLRRSAGRQSKT